MFRNWLTALAMLVLLMPSGAGAQMAFVEGTDYQAVSSPVDTGRPDKVVVTELFWYGCPHCFRFESYVESWSAQLPDGVVFEQVPSIVSAKWAEHARAYYAFQTMGVLEQVHRKFFDAIHLDRKRLDNLDAIAEFVAGQGIDEKAFREAYHSFPVETQLRKNLQKEKRYGHNGVPTIIVNGKYMVSTELARSFERMLQITDFLVSLELKQ